MLKPANMRILRCKFHRLPIGQNAVDGLFGFNQRLVLLDVLIFEAEGLLKKRLHLADRIAAQDRDFQAFLFEFLQGARLPLLLRF